MEWRNYAFANLLSYTFPIKHLLKPGLKYLKYSRTACQRDNNVLYITRHCFILEQMYTDQRNDGISNVHSFTLSMNIEYFAFCVTRILHCKVININGPFKRKTIPTLNPNYPEISKEILEALTKNDIFRVPCSNAVTPKDTIPQPRT